MTNVDYVNTIRTLLVMSCAIWNDDELHTLLTIHCWSWDSIRVWCYLIRKVKCIVEREESELDGGYFEFKCLSTISTCRSYPRTEVYMCI